ncbi:MAG TPA: alpha-L-fucosidase [Verrucomicrobiae bacterium]|nr:alpha-L-fucosidase [Verrucomicrobiae bacterium]
MNRRHMLKTLAAAAAASRLQGQPRTYTPDWSSLDPRPTPAWWREARFGIFIHWGVYSVPAFAPVHSKGETQYAEWYWHSMTEGKRITEAARGSNPSGDGVHTWEFHKRVYGADFPYSSFAPMFRAELFDPDQWADIFARSGAKYVALTSKHHDGFTLWRSAEANRSWGRAWNAVDTGPKRDLLLDLSLAGRKRGLHMGLYYSLYEWYNPLWLSDKARYVREHMMPQFRDVVTHAQPSVIFADGEWELASGEWHSPELQAWLFNESPVRDEVVIDDRWGKDTRHAHGGYYTTEYTPGLKDASHLWEESRGMGYSYGYNRMETADDYHTARELILMLVDIVSRGGNLLLDIGPTGDGRIPVIMQERLLQMGDWLKVNGEAIYGASTWTNTRQWSAGAVPELKETQFMGAYEISKLVDSPPPGSARIEAFFTRKAGNLYVMVPRWPAQGIAIPDLKWNAGARITLLAGNRQVEWRAEGSGIRILVPPAMAPPDQPVHVFRLAM